jgi:hypothetical protein
MEFETNTAPPDDARLLAQAKKVTIAPVHSDVTPDDLPDSVIAAQHVNSGAIANVSNDIEQDAAPITPAENTPEPADTIHPKDKARIYILTAVGLVLFAIVAVVVIVQ